MNKNVNVNVFALAAALVLAVAAIAFKWADSWSVRDVLALTAAGLAALALSRS